MLLSSFFRNSNSSYFGGHCHKATILKGPGLARNKYILTRFVKLYCVVFSKKVKTLLQLGVASKITPLKGNLILAANVHASPSKLKQTCIVFTCEKLKTSILSCNFSCLEKSFLNSCFIHHEYYLGIYTIVIEEEEMNICCTAMIFVILNMCETSVNRNSFPAVCQLSVSALMYWPQTSSLKQSELCYVSMSWVVWNWYSDRTKVCISEAREVFTHLNLLWCKLQAEIVVYLQHRAVVGRPSAERGPMHCVKTYRMRCGWLTLVSVVNCGIFGCRHKLL